MSESSSDINPEWKLITIGRGSLALVSILSGRPVAFKHVIFPSRTPELKAEFETLCSLHNTCNTDSFFEVPHPHAYYDPNIPTSFVSPNHFPKSKGRRPARRPLVAEKDFKALNLDNAAYAMDQVLPLPISTALIIRKLFYPPGQEMAPPPSLCRLYFGKVIETKALPSGRPSRFFNSANFPLDVSRYSQMTEVAHVDDYPNVDEIAHGMGEMLGLLHWRAGYDGRDIEFIMGGASFSGIAMNVIDFNQMRAWSRKKEDVHQLVESFFTNDPYYPRPRPEDPLYQKFCVGYMDAYPKNSDEAIQLAQDFLRTIEAEQGRRDSIT
ncbi:hypothetical protein F5887DRAFT_1005001 [Amanita rubescens]|nr:hypothetical protein F5887DRAFT_1005001 [Amanita rubescens]